MAIKIPTALWNKALEFRASLVSMRDDINSNTSDCSKLLYRLEEAELQIKVNESKLANIERALGPF